MQRSTLDQKTDQDPRTKQGLQWIGKNLENIAKLLGVRIASWNWQFEASTHGENVYSLSVAGARNKRAVKLFDKEEIDRCVSNEVLQEEIRQRLTKLITFLGPNQ